MEPLVEKPGTRYTRTLREKFLSRGLCQYCGKEPLIPGRKYGESCRSKTIMKTKVKKPKIKGSAVVWSIS